MMKRKNRKLPRRGKVIIPAWTINTRNRLERMTTLHRRRVVLAVRLAVAAIIVYAFAVGPVGAIRLVNLSREKSDLHTENQRLNAELVQLDNICRRLETDTTYIEKIAREEYGLSRPGEIIYLEPESSDR